MIITGGQGPSTQTNFSFVVSHSHDNGATWTRCNLSSLLSGWCYTLAVAPSLPAVIFAGGQVSGQGAVYRSSDRGVTWLPTTTAPPDTVYGLVVHPTDAGRVYAATHSGVFLTTDAGATWSNLGGGTALRAIVLHPQTPDTVAVAGDSGVMISGDGGQHWTAQNQGLEIRTVSSLGYTGTGALSLIAGTQGRGCFLWSPATATSERNEPVRSVDANAFPALVSRVLHLPAGPGYVGRGAALLDIAGRRVVELHVGDNDLSAFAPGVYFLVLSCAGGGTPRKIVVQH